MIRQLTYPTSPDSTVAYRTSVIGTSTLGINLDSLEARENFFRLFQTLEIYIALYLFHLGNDSNIQIVKRSIIPSASSPLQFWFSS